MTDYLKQRVYILSTLMSAGVLSACTVIEIEGDSNSIGDSGNHSGSLTVPEPNTTRTDSLPKIHTP